MTSLSAIARPYADAVFAVAAGDAGRIGAWSTFLARAAVVVRDERVAQLLLNPRADKTRLLELVAEIALAGADAAADDAQQRNLLKLLAANGRLTALPAIASRFEQLRAEAEGTVQAVITAAFEVSDAQRDAITDALAKKLGRKVTARTVVDESLIGGIVVRAGDWVLDASARGQLAQLQSALSVG
ncbi:MAG: F0F1 ATP synthase subunit delta [Gammaproteobacteria bacterium]|nr:F0F1 ATP synthase subunit delta [Gammaproteobacteria bacterium]